MKYAARRSMRLAVRHGLLTPQACIRCGSKKNIHGHHSDYSQPLFITWLCRACHVEQHKLRSHSPIEDVIFANPGLTSAKIAAICGVSGTRIYQIKQRIARRQLARTDA